MQWRSLSQLLLKQCENAGLRIYSGKYTGFYPAPFFVGVEYGYLKRKCGLCSHDSYVKQYISLPFL